MNLRINLLAGGNDPVKNSFMKLPIQNSKVILVTGSSSGFGKLIVSLLLERGHRVIAGIRGGVERFSQVFSKEIAQYGSRLVSLDLHLDQSESIDQVTDFIQENFNNRLDVLINNAGYGLFGALEDQSPKQLRHEFEVNFFGPTFLTRSLLPVLRASQGRVLVMSSIAGLYPFPYYGSYCSSKFALEAQFEALHYELKPLKVQVGLIEPGGFKTNFNITSKKMAEGSSDLSSPYALRTRSLQHRLENSTVRLGNPQRVAKVVAKLCEQKHIPLRTLVGVDAWSIHLLSRLLPDAWRVRAEDKAFRKLIFRD